jgi:hypothetical protein
VIELIQQDFIDAERALRQALPLIELAHPKAWRSPAATAYQQWLGDIGERCRRAMMCAGQNEEEVVGYRAMIVNQLGEP